MPSGGIGRFANRTKSPACSQTAPSSPDSSIASKSTKGQAQIEITHGDYSELARELDEFEETYQNAFNDESPPSSPRFGAADFGADVDSPAPSNKVAETVLLRSGSGPLGKLKSKQLNNVVDKPTAGNMTKKDLPIEEDSAVEPGASGTKLAVPNDSDAFRSKGNLSSSKGPRSQDLAAPIHTMGQQVRGGATTNGRASQFSSERAGTSAAELQGQNGSPSKNAQNESDLVTKKTYARNSDTDIVEKRRGLVTPSEMGTRQDLNTNGGIVEEAVAHENSKTPKNLIQQFDSTSSNAQAPTTAVGCGWNNRKIVVDEVSKLRQSRNAAGPGDEVSNVLQSRNELAPDDSPPNNGDSIPPSVPNDAPAKDDQVTLQDDSTDKDQNTEEPISTSPKADEEKENGESIETSFDDMFSQFLVDLRDSNDINERGEATLIDRNVQLASVYSLALQRQGEMLDLLDEFDEIDAMVEAACNAAVY